MPKVPFGSNNTGSDTLNYPPDLLSQTAAKILANADEALNEHDKAWKKAQNYVESIYPGLRLFMIEILIPHEQRVRDSYQWQINLATALFDAVKRMTDTEDKMKSTFDLPGHTNHAL